MGVLRAVEIADEAQPSRGARARALRPIARIDPDPRAAAPLAEPDQELALAAADLERRHSRSQPEPLDLIVPDLVEEFQEPRRESLRLFVSRRVTLQRRIEPDIADEAASAAKAQLDVSAR